MCKPSDLRNHNTFTPCAVPCVSPLTVTSKRANIIGADTEHVTVVFSASAFINIWKVKPLVSRRSQLPHVDGHVSYETHDIFPFFFSFSLPFFPFKVVHPLARKIPDSLWEEPYLPMGHTKNGYHSWGLSGPHYELYSLKTTNEFIIAI